jgi:hypothetical protein
MSSVRRTLLAGVATAGVGVAVLVAVSAVQSGSASAQDSSERSEVVESSAPAHGGRFGWGHGPGFGPGHGDFLADLAAELDISEEELRDAINAVVDQRLDDAVADGHLTQDQVDRLRDRRAEIEEAVASGTLDEYMRGELADRLQPRLMELVDRGMLTQEQMDELLDALMDGTLRETLEEFDLPGLRGHFRHFGPFDGRGFRFEFRGFGPSDGGSGFGIIVPNGGSGT